MATPTTMASPPLAAIAPLASPLPPPPPGEVLTAAQWATLFAIGDAVIADVAPVGDAASRTTLAVGADAYARAERELVAGASESVTGMFGGVRGELGTGVAGPKSQMLHACLMDC